AQSSPASATTPAPPASTPPSAPTALTAIAVPASHITLSWTASSDSVAESGYRAYRRGSQYGTTGATPFTNARASRTPTYSYTVAAYDAAGNVSAQSSPASATTPAPSTSGTVPTPYTGTPIAVPGSFEAENFDLGGEGVAYHDNTPGNQGGLYRITEDVDIIVSYDTLGGGYVVNNFETGEWLAYTVNVAASALYNIELRASSEFANNAL